MWVFTWASRLANSHLGGYVKSGGVVGVVRVLRLHMLVREVERRQGTVDGGSREETAVGGGGGVADCHAGRPYSCTGWLASSNKSAQTA